MKTYIDPKAAKEIIDILEEKEGVATLKVELKKIIKSCEPRSVTFEAYHDEIIPAIQVFLKECEGMEDEAIDKFSQWCNKLQGETLKIKIVRSSGGGIGTKIEAVHVTTNEILDISEYNRW